MVSLVLVGVGTHIHRYLLPSSLTLPYKNAPRTLQYNLKLHIGETKTPFFPLFFTFSLMASVRAAAVWVVSAISQTLKLKMRDSVDGST